MEIQSYPAVNADGFVRSELDNTVSLTCLTQGGSGTRAEEELVWLRNGAQVQLMDGNKHGSSSLCVTPVTREDNTATFTCQLKRDANVNASVTLDITCESKKSDLLQAITYIVVAFLEFGVNSCTNNVNFDSSFNI